MEIVRLGIIGMGQRTVYHGFVPEVERCKGVKITALCDVKEDRLKKGLEDYQKALGYELRGFTDFGEFLDAGAADAVYLATPNYTHRAMTEQAVAGGLDVLCEKPMATTIADCDAMIEAAEKHGKILAIGQQMNYRERYHKVMELIETGRIGEPTMLSCIEYRCPFKEMKDWVWRKEYSGGAIVEKNCHHYGLLDWWAKGKPTKVYASGGQKKYSTIYGVKSELVDNAYVLADYDNGARSLVGVCFLSTKDWHFREFAVIGTEGRVWFDNRDGEVIHFRNPHKNIQEDFKIDGVLRGGMLQDFVDCVRERKRPLMTGEEGRASLLIPAAAQLSLELGRVVEIGEVSSPQRTGG